MFGFGKSKREWIGKSGSGPLVVLPLGRADSWSGQPGPDYVRARAVDDYLAFIDFGDGQAMVLGDEAFDTTWVSLPGNGGGIFVRRLWSEEPQDAIDAVRALPAEAWSFEEGVLDVPNGQLILFDAARRGDAIPDGLLIALPAGRYAVATADAHPDDDTCAMAHRLLAIH